MNCELLKQLIGEHFSENLVHVERDGVCSITLPFLTSDGRHTTIFIEPRTTDYFLVHDGGKTVDELFQQGINVTAKVNNKLAALAAKYGLVYSDETFQWAGRAPYAPHILALAGCCVAASLLLLESSGGIQQEIGPIEQIMSYQGMITRIGGRGRAINVQLLDHTGVVRNGSCSLTLATQLRVHLLEGAVRLTGRARLFRGQGANGAWRLERFRIQSFEVLHNGSLSEAFDAARKAVTASR